MRNTFIALLAGTVLLASCNTPVKGKNGVTYKDPVQYNDYIVEKQDQVIKLVEKFGTESNAGADKANAFIAEATAKIDKMITDVEGMPEWKSNSDMREKAVAMFKYYRSIFAVSYKRLIAISADGEVTPEEETEQQDIIKKISTDGGPVEDAFLAAQKDFAKKNNMKLETKTFK